MSTLFRFRYKELGEHTHVRVFSGKGTLSLGLAGKLVFRNEEWADFLTELNRGQFGGGSIEIVQENTE